MEGETTHLSEENKVEHLQDLLETKISHTGHKKH